MKEKTIDIDALKQDEHNFNKGTAEGQRLIEKSFKELGAGRSILVDRDNNIIAGNKSQKAAIASGIKKVRIIETDGSELIAVKRTDLDIDSEEGRKLAFADNLTTQVNLAWDEVELRGVQSELEDFDCSDWGFALADAESEAEMIERKRKDFEEKMRNGELSDDDPEYQEFCAKFEEKKTTDDCYTPVPVYEAVADWVANEYRLSKANFKRPFYPGGDYKRERYESNEVVVDNPPFSILAEILTFYKERGILFFLFGPHLTLISSAVSGCTILPVGISVMYENRATVSTSFITNLEPKNIKARSVPSLYKAIKEADKKNRKENTKELPKYKYDKHVVTVSNISSFSKYGIDFCINNDECVVISQLDAQKEVGKAIYGRALLVSDKVVAEREKAEREKEEREKAEREKAIVWSLSEREQEMVKKISVQQ